MSTEQNKKQSTPFSFVSHDGTDENGVRAEVNVQVNKGTIKEIRENTAKEVADVHFAVPNTKFPIHGWIRTDEPVYELVKTARDNDEQVSFRIETQRKANVERKRPMEDFKDPGVARENVKVILVGINNVLSGEAVTNPDEDPKHSGGRYVASTTDMANPSAGNPQAGSATVNVEELLANFKAASATPGVRGSVLDAMAAQLLLNGVAPETVNVALAGPDKRDNSRPEPRQNFSTEAPSWKEYNSDGRLNLGSGVIAAGVGVDTLINDRIQTQAEEKSISLSQLTNVDDAASYYMDIVFAITDRVQVASYGEGSRVDRAAASHTRIRGIVYELIKKSFPLPIGFSDNNDGTHTITYSEEAHRNWVSSVGKEGVKRFRRAVEASISFKGFAVPVPASLTGNAVATERPQSVPAPAVSQPEPEVAQAQPEPTAAPQVEEKTQPSAADRLATARSIIESGGTGNISVVNDEPEATEEEVVAASETPAVAASSENVYDSSVLYPQQHLNSDEVEGEELPSDETITNFKQMFADSGFDVSDKGDLIRITKLLAYTFGADYSNVKKIPEALVEDFIDHYSAGGPEVLDHAVRVAVENV